MPSEKGCASLFSSGQLGTTCGHGRRTTRDHWNDRHLSDRSAHFANTEILELLPDAVIVADDGDAIQYANRRATSLLDCAFEEITGRTLGDFGLSIASAGEDGVPLSGPIQAVAITSNREQIQVEIECEKVVGQPLTLLVLRDVSRHLRSDMQVAVQRDVLDMISNWSTIDEVGERLVQYLEDVFPGSAAVLYQYDPAVSAFSPLAGPLSAELLEQDPGGIQRSLLSTRLSEVSSSGSPQFFDAENEQSIAAHPALEACWCFPVSPSTGANGGAFCLFRDRHGAPSREHERLIETATDLLRIALDRVYLDRDAQSQRFNDELTGLPNRVLLLDRLDQALQRAARSDQMIAVILINLDRLQMVNDGLGYQAGDELLQKSGERLRNLIRSGDLVARFIGDDFAVLLENIASEEDAINVVMRIQRAFAVPVSVADVEVFATLSIGVALSDGTGADAEALLRQADVAKQRAQEGNRGQFAVFSSSDAPEPAPRLELQSRLYRALAANAFDLHYQPLVSLRDGSVIGYEALIRWHDEQFGDISPETFLPMAEQSGIMSEITAWILDRAVSQLRDWNTVSPYDLVVGVNVSPSEVNDPLLVEQVDAVLNRYQVLPSQLTLELTEHGLMDITGRGREILQRLRNLGVEIALDDFGTGFSSLAYLEQLPVDTIKIDRTFIHSARGGVSRAPVAAAMVDLARNLGMSSVAEGIEIEEDERIARRLGCDLSQGYFYGRPRPASTMDRWSESD